MLEFETAAKQATQEQDGEVEGTPFKVDGRECFAYFPGDGQVAVLMASNASHASGEERVAGIINFFASVLDDESHSWLVSRLLDRRDHFGIDEVEKIMRGLLEEWSGRPTKSSSGSTPSRSKGGRKSTQRTPALT